MSDEEKGCWFTKKTGVHVFVKDGQTVEKALEERFGKGEKKDGKTSAESAIKMTSAEKIASVHNDFDKDNILPELEEDSLKAMGVKRSKSVLLKKSVIDRNAEQHPDLSKDDFQSIVTKALYSPSDIFSANSEKPYFHFARPIQITSKGKSEIGLALLDVDESKDSFEVVHAHFMRVKNYEKAKKKEQQKKD